MSSDLHILFHFRGGGHLQQITASAIWLKSLQIFCIVNNIFGVQNIFDNRSASHNWLANEISFENKCSFLPSVNVSSMFGKITGCLRFVLHLEYQQHGSYELNQMKHMVTMGNRFFSIMLIITDMECSCIRKKSMK